MLIFLFQTSLGQHKIRSCIDLDELLLGVNEGAEEISLDINLEGNSEVTGICNCQKRSEKVNKLAN